MDWIPDVRSGMTKRVQNLTPTFISGYIKLEKRRITMKSLQVVELLGRVEAYNTLLAHFMGDDHAGGYFHLLVGYGSAPIEELPVAIMKFGSFPEEKNAGRMAKAAEKAKRLAIRREDQTSWQSRNPDAHQWGGAIRVRYEFTDIILSFSGHPECWDEALMLAVAVAMRWISKEAADAIASDETKPCLNQLI
jgi:hypothetical protein